MIGKMGISLDVVRNHDCCNRNYWARMTGAAVTKLRSVQSMGANLRRRTT